MPAETFFNLPEDKRQRIIDCAVDEFAEHPYAAASLSQIVARAGISKGSMYQYFENKLDLYRWLALEYAGQKKIVYFPEHIAQDPMGASISFFEFLRDGAIAGCLFTVDHPKLARAALRLVEPTPVDELQQLHRSFADQGMAFWHARIRMAIDAGELRSDLDVELFAPLVSHIIGLGLVHQLMALLGMDQDEFLRSPIALRRISRRDIDRVVDHTITFVRAGAGARDTPNTEDLS